MEVGTVTPKGQPGNEQPRLFRLPPDEALINRMGFNNEGAEAMAKGCPPSERRIPVAVNIGKNKATPNEKANGDYEACIQALFPYGDFLLSTSAPRTRRTCAFSMGSELSSLLEAVKNAKPKFMEARRPFW